MSNTRTIFAPMELTKDNREEFKKLLLGDPRAEIVADFRATRFIDSSGLGTLVSARKAIVLAGGKLTLNGLNEDLQMLFELTELDVLFGLREGFAKPALI